MNTLLRVEHLTKQFPAQHAGLWRRKHAANPAVDDVGFTLADGEAFGIVGESGCGKTTLARLVLRLIEPSGGQIFFRDQEVTALSALEMKKLRPRMQMIFQDPYSSLDPKKTILQIVAEPLKVHKIVAKTRVEETVKDALKLVDLPTTEDFLYNIPDELSGGQRQRVGIARALILGAELIVADEPVTMLDATVKSEIIALLMRLKQERRLTYIFITHEIALAYYFCERIAVMYLGKIVEMGNTESIIHEPRHCYTQLLMHAIPPLLPDARWIETLLNTETALNSRNASSATDTLTGCRFHPRCPQVTGICREQTPELIEIRPNHLVACHRYRA